MLLTRTPLYSQYCYCFLVRLACVKRAASVDSEPGSNSRLNRLGQIQPKGKAEPTTDVLDHFGLELKLLTKLRLDIPLRKRQGRFFYLASNQIVKDLHVPR